MYSHTSAANVRFPPIADTCPVWEARRMASKTIAVAAGFLAACASETVDEREAIMDLIERQVQLPTGARPLGEYARYYADTGNGEITAVYMMPMDDQPRPGDTCARLDENFAAQV